MNEKHQIYRYPYNQHRIHPTDTTRLRDDSPSPVLVYISIATLHCHWKNSRILRLITWIAQNILGKSEVWAQDILITFPFQSAVLRENLLYAPLVLSSLLPPTNEFLAKVMFLHLSVILFTEGGVCPIACCDTHTSAWAGTHPRADRSQPHNPRPPPSAQIPPGKHPPPSDTTG